MGAHNAASSGVMQLLKDGVGQERPGAQGNTSFPSGHTNTAFIGASFLQQRYGPRWGVPAYVAAAVVGDTRLHSNVHYMADVISGASIAMLSAWFLVPPYDAERRALWADLERQRKWRYEWGMSLNTIDRNLVQSPKGQGTLFEAPHDTENNEPWANGHISLEYRLDERRSVVGSFSPWEARSFGELPQPTTFAGETFPANTEVRSAHQLWNFGVQYRHAVVDNDRLDARLGAGLTGQYIDYELFVVDETQPPENRGQSASESAFEVYGVGHADLDVKLFWKLYLSGDVDLGLNDGSNFLHWQTLIKLRFNSKWDVGAGWTEFTSDLRTQDLVNDFVRSGFVVNFGYSF